MAYQNYPDSELNPRKLSEEEVKDPYLVIERFFDYEKLPGIRELMWTWLRTTIAGTYCEQADDREKTELFDFYEQVEKLVEAAHIIHVRSNLHEQ